MSPMIKGTPFLTTREIVLLAISLAVSVLYCVHELFGRSFLEVILKGASILILALIVFMRRPSRPGIMLGVGLLLHSAGDIMLRLDETNLFLPALGGFFLGHLCYLLAFIMYLRSSPPVPAWRKIESIPLTIPFIVMMIVLGPHVKGAIAFAVPVYMLVITAMGITSILAGFRPPLVQTGVILFMLSDCIIALTTFMTPMEHSRFLTWPTYYIGQILITLGFLYALEVRARHTR